MENTLALLFAIVPASLIILAAAIIHKTGPAERASRQFFLLLETTTLVLLLALTALQFLPPPATGRLYWINTLFIPVIFGMVILAIASLPQLRGSPKRDTWLIILLGLASAGLIVYHLRDPSAWLVVLPGGLFTLGVAWLASGKPSHWVWIFPAIAVLAWVVFNHPSNANLLRLTPISRFLVSLASITAPVLSVAVMGLFFSTGLGMLRNPAAGTESHPARAIRVEGFLRLLAALVLLALTVYSAVWASIWDQTSDGLGGVSISMMAGLVAVACGMLIGVRASGLGRLAGIAFAAIVVLSVQAGFHAGWRISFPKLTEQRGAQIAQALERFHQRENRYPSELSELIPRDLLYIPQPVMFRGESWCYQGAADAYRLAAFFHTYFGMPVSLHVYAAAGQLGDRPLPCHERLAEMEAKYDWTHP